MKSSPYEQSNFVDISCAVLRESPSGLAYLIVTDDGDEAWVPKSLVEYDEDTLTMTMPEWLAVEKELV